MSIFLFRRFFQTTFVLFAILAICTQTSLADSRPLLFVPGILGSILLDKTGAIVWGDSRSLSRLDKLTIADGPRDPIDGLVPSATINEIAVLGLFKIKEYRELRATLKSLGYVDGVNYFEFPYDWRQSNYTTARKLSEFIEQNPALANGQFDILAHSMGGLVAQIYVKEFDNSRKRVVRLINMAVPFKGSVSTIATLTDGWGASANWIAGGVTKVRRFALSMPSFYELLPLYENCCILGRPEDSDRKPYDVMLEDTWSAIDWFPGETLSPARKDSINLALAAAKKLRALEFVPYPSHVRVYLLAGSSVDTPFQFYVDRSRKSVVRYNRGAGDGTVWEVSAASGDLSKAYVSMAQHGTIFDDVAAVEALKRILRVTPPGPENYSEPSYPSRTTGGEIATVRSVGVSLNPFVLEPGSITTLLVRIVAEAGKPADKFSVIALAHSANGEAIPVRLTSRAENSAQASVGIYEATIPVGNALGPGRVKVLIDGLPTLQEFFVVETGL